MKKSKRFGDLLIDLTPLLDVIFILLIVVLAYQQSRGAEADRKIYEAETYVEDANSELARMKNALDRCQDQLDTYENMSEYVTVVRFSSEYDDANRKHRTIYVKVNDEDDKSYEINPSNETQIWKECKEYILEHINEETPVVFSILNSKMLYRDEQSIVDLIENIEIEDARKVPKNFYEVQ